MSEQVKFPKLFAVDVDKLEAVRIDARHQWGWEIWLVNSKEMNVCCKLLIIYPGWMSSLHGHETKSEYFIILSGELKLYVYPRMAEVYPDAPFGFPEVMELDAGQQYFIPEKTYHKFATGTKQFVLLLEVSSYEDELTTKLEASRPIGA